MTKQRNLKLILLAVISVSIVIVFAGCDQNLSPKGSAGFTILLPSNGNARNIGLNGAITKYGAVATWRITGSSSTTNTTFTKDFSGTARIANIENVEPGEWKISVIGLDARKVQLFYASVKCTLVEGENKLTITMEKDPTAIAKIEVWGPKIYDGGNEKLTTADQINFTHLGNSTVTNKIRFSIKNTGKVDLILSATLAGNDDAFSFPEVPPTSPVAPGDSVIFDVLFTTPNSKVGAGGSNAKLTITSNDPDTPSFVLNLIGTYSYP